MPGKGPAQAGPARDLPAGAPSRRVAPTLLATRGADVARATLSNGTWRVESTLAGAPVRALCADPATSARAWAGGDGAWRSDDAGATWRRAGLEDREVTAIAARGRVVVAGLKPVGIAWSDDAGATWSEQPFPKKWWWFSPSELPMTPYVQALALSPTDPSRCVAGVEVGGVHVTRDAGRTWTRGKGAVLDCHALAAHASEGERFAQGGAGTTFGAASADGGATWTKAPRFGKHAYGWAVATDPAHPDRTWHAASTGPGAAHGGRDANARILRVDGNGARAVAGPLVGMPYGLAWSGRALLAALSNGEVWESADGEAPFARLPLALGAVHRAFAAIPP